MTSQNVLASLLGMAALSDSPVRRRLPPRIRPKATKARLDLRRRKRKRQMQRMSRKRNRRR